MRWSWTMGRIGGIPIRLHVTLLLFIPYLVFAVTLQFRLFAEILGVSPAAFVLPPLAWGVILGLGVLAAILAHEWAHSAVALASGVPVHSITLMMLGGVSRIGGDITSAGREAWMAAAGPLASLVIGGVSLGLQLLLPPEPMDLRIALIVFGQINIVLAIFNLLPAFPMDGGRILRAALSARMGRLRATRIAAWVGRIMAVGFALLGLFVIHNPILILIAAFVFLGAGAELSGLEMRQSGDHIRLISLVDPRLGVVDADDTLRDSADAFARGGWVAALVRGAGPEQFGLVTAGDISEALRDDGSTRVGELESRRLRFSRPESEFSGVVPFLAEDPRSAVVIVDHGGKPLGVLLAEALVRSPRFAQLVGGSQ